MMSDTYGIDPSLYEQGEVAAPGPIDPELARKMAEFIRHWRKTHPLVPVLCKIVELPMSTPKFDTHAVTKLVRGAFAKALIGEDQEARALWAKAIQKGYDPQPKNVKGFEIAIERGLRETRR